jgi:hypothetical protein
LRRDRLAGKEGEGMSEVRAVDVDLNQFSRWAAEKPRRSVTIEIGDPCNNEYLNIYAYDYDLSTGQHVTSVEEIDLDAKYEADLEEKIQTLRNHRAKRETA